MPTSQFRTIAGALTVLVTSCAATASETDTAPATVYRQYVDAFSRGQIDAALGYFADDAVVTAGPACTATAPCIGKAAIRERYLAVLLARKLPAPLSDQRSDGVRRLRTRGEPALFVAPDGAVTRLKGGHTFEFVGGRIVSLSYALDRSDAETAAFLATMLPAPLARLDDR